MSVLPPIQRQTGSPKCKTFNNPDAGVRSVDSDSISIDRVSHVSHSRSRFSMCQLSISISNGWWVGRRRAGGQACRDPPWLSLGGSLEVGWPGGGFSGHGNSRQRFLILPEAVVMSRSSSKAMVTVSISIIYFSIFRSRSAQMVMSQF